MDVQSTTTCKQVLWMYESTTTCKQVLWMYESTTTCKQVLWIYESTTTCKQVLMYEFYGCTNLQQPVNKFYVRIYNNL